jgi:glyoxylate/hydroxypyruvate reductase A
MTDSRPDDRLVVLIASPLEPEHAARIAAVAPERVRVVYEPDLLPVTRYAADHHGLRRDLSESDVARWRDFLAEADVLFDFDWLDPAGMPRNCPRLRWVQATSAGIGEYLVQTRLADSAIVFTTAAGVHAIPLAEFVALGLLYLVKGVPWLREQQRDHLWERYTTVQLAGRRMLQVGLGNVGRQIARTCAALGVEVWGMDPSFSAPPAGVTELVPRVELTSSLQRVDALVLSCPYTKETHHLIGREELRAMPRGAHLVNVSRGPVIDEPELVAALRDGHLGGAVLDVFEEEPLPADSALWDMPNVLVSPHSASTVVEENSRIADLFIDNLRRYLEGQELRNLFVAARAY